MAEMRPSEFPLLFPENLESREKEIFELLRENLPDQAIIIYEPMLFDKNNKHHQPDFVIFWQKCGPLVLEAKNWNFDLIESSDDMIVTMRKPDGARVTTTNPYRSALKYANALSEHLMKHKRENPIFLHEEGHHAGKLKFCIGSAILFMETREDDLPRIQRTLCVPSVEAIITEEALRDKNLLRMKLSNIPRIFPNLGNASQLKAAANLIRPRSETTEVRSLPVISSRIAAETPGESEIDRYHRLRKDLLAGSLEIENLISADNPQNRHIETLQQIQDSLESDFFLLGFYGVTSAGKSTLINGMIKKPVLREGLGETSKIITRIFPPTMENPDGTVIIEYKGIKAINNEISEHYRRLSYFLDNKDPQINIEDAAFRNMLSGLLKKVSSDDWEIRQSVTYLQHVLAGWPKCEAFLEKQVKLDFASSDEIAHNEDIATYILQRTIYDDNPLTRLRIVLVDSPGLGSAYARHTGEALELARIADATIMVTKIDYKFMPPDQIFIRDAIDVQRTKDLKNLIFVLNQIGRINPTQYASNGQELEIEQCLEKEIFKLRERLEGFGIKDAQIYAIDAACGRWSRSIAENPQSREIQRAYEIYSMVDKKAALPDPAQNLAASRLLVFEEGLRNHLKQIKYHCFLGRKLDSLKKIITSYNLDVENEIEAMKVELEELIKRKQLHEKNKLETMEALEDFMQITLPGLIMRDYGDLNEKISSLIESTAGIISGIFKETYWKKSTFGPNAFIQDVLQESGRAVRKIVQELRDSYETRYKEVREKALNKKIPQIIETYGSGISWDLKQEDLEQAIAEQIRGLEGIEIGFWKALIANLLVLGGIPKESLKGIITRQIFENYNYKFSVTFRHDIASWVKKDMEYFQKQVLENFGRLMTNIENQINRQIEAVASKDGEKQQRSRELLHFKEQSSKAISKLHELQVQVDKARPSAVI